MFAASFFEGAAFSWFQPLLTADPEHLLQSFEQFATRLLRTFGDSFLKENAEDRLLELRQTGAVAAFSSEFRRLAAHVGINEAGLVAIFRRGLKPSIQDELAKIPDHFDSVAALTEVAIRIDQRMFARQHSRRAPDSRSDFPRRVVARPPVHPAPVHVHHDQSVPMEIGSVNRFKPLSNEEKDRRRREGLCMYCGKPGHVALRCPAKRPSQRAAATKMTFNLVQPDSTVPEPSSSKNV